MLAIAINFYKHFAKLILTFNLKGILAAAVPITFLGWGFVIGLGNQRSVLEPNIITNY